ncbi:MAG: fused response regulator/phosphatase [Acidobacteriaceae bacterium]|nr:fused response regulator/phosphatase [Acidobacteriaceae bacterium]MBV9498537.1 fused response regulator/phosphatase [Acidobacteriaceae bacterium]
MSDLNKTVLVVDDQPDVTEALRLLLKGAGYSAQIAQSPGEALAHSYSTQPDLVVMDMNFTWDTTSGEEGLRLLDGLRAHRHDLPIIAMTGWSTIDLAVRAMQRGACDFVPKPWDNKQFLSVVAKHLNVEKQPRERLDAELTLAQKVQRKLLPQPQFSAFGLQCECVSIPRGEIGGDLYDFIEIDEGAMAFVLGDVSGKGIGSALLVANLQATLRARTDLARRPAELMRRVNQLFFDSTRPEFFATVFFGLYEPESESIRYVNCGHPPPVLIRSEGRPESLEPTATVLGAFKRSEFVEESIRLNPGDRLVLFTDGFSEAEIAAESSDWPVDRIHRLSRNCDKGLAMTLASLALGTGEQADDITVMEIRRV